MQTKRKPRLVSSRVSTTGIFLKWVGGKGALVPEIVSRLPTRIRTYREICTGSGAVFFALAAESTRRYEYTILSDVSLSLMEVYRVVRDDVDGLIASLERYAAHVDALTYYRVRGKREWPGSGVIPADPVLRAARFIYVNKLCWRGLYRENLKGEFRVPYGNYKNPRVCAPDVLRAASRALRDVELVVSDAETEIGRAEEGDAVYYDPPYIPASTTANFDNYSAGGFSLDDHRRCAAALARASERGAHVLISASATALSCEVYATPHSSGPSGLIEEVMHQHAINPHEKGQGSRKVTVEYLIRYNAAAGSKL